MKPKSSRVVTVYKSERKLRCRDELHKKAQQKLDDELKKCIAAKEKIARRIIVLKRASKTINTKG